MQFAENSLCLFRCLNPLGKQLCLADRAGVLFGQHLFELSEDFLHLNIVSLCHEERSFVNIFALIINTFAGKAAIEVFGGKFIEADMEKGADPQPIKEIDGIEFYAEPGYLRVEITDYHCKSIMISKQQVLDMLLEIPEEQQ